jgi:hypothetical protein
VVQHVLLGREAAAACVANPRLLTGVNLEFQNIAKPDSAKSKWEESTHPSMNLQLTLANKSMFAELTEPRLAPLWVSLLLVREQARLDGEAAAAQVTGERSLASVDPAGRACQNVWLDSKVAPARQIVAVKSIGRSDRIEASLLLLSLTLCGR